MTKKLVVGNETFLYPENGTSPIEDWGQNASDWAQAITDIVGDIFAPGDITLTTFPLSDNITSFTNIVGLKFSTTTILAAKVEYTIKRIVGATTYTEYGVILGTFDGTIFSISQEAVGDAGITFDVTNLGQFQYKSTNLSHTSCILKFKASTIAQ